MLDNKYVFHHSAVLSLNQKLQVAIQLGTVNDLRSVQIRPKSQSGGLGSHVIRLYEGRTITNTDDPQLGRRRDRRLSDETPSFPGLSQTDLFLFHTSFDDGGDGLLLAQQVSETGGEADLGKWIISRGTGNNVFYMIELESLTSGDNEFGIFINYSFVRNY